MAQKKKKGDKSLIEQDLAENVTNTDAPRGDVKVTQN